jgi:hypothetical protein
MIQGFNPVEELMSRIRMRVSIAVVCAVVLASTGMLAQETLRERRIVRKRGARPTALRRKD